MSIEFENFCRAEYERVFRAAYALCGDRELAADATQEAFGRAFARWKRLHDEPWAGGWVMTTALNYCRSHFRRARKSLTGGLANAEAPGPEPGPERADLVRALRTLPARQRQAVILHYLGDLPVVRVAGLMNLSEGTVKAYLFRARSLLRTKLETVDPISPTCREVPHVRP